MDNGNYKSFSGIMNKLILIHQPGGAVARLKRGRDWGQDAPGGFAQLDPENIRADAKKRVNFMPLEMFDDYEFETKTPMEWMSSVSEGGAVCAVTQWFNMNTNCYEQRAVKVCSFGTL